MTDLLDTAVAAVQAGAEELRPRFRSGTLVVEEKAANDHVTDADRAAETAVVSVLQERFPDDAILTEEGGRLGNAGADRLWIIDPLDGTTNFLRGLPNFGVAVAARQRGELVAAAVVDPLRRDLFTAERGSGFFWNDRRVQVSNGGGLDGAFLATGFPFKARAALSTYLSTFGGVFERAKAIRRCGAAVLDLAYTAAGVYDGFFEFRLAPWDIAAGALFLQEAGGRVTDLDGGGRYLERGNVVGGSPAVHQELLAVTRGFVTEEKVDQLVPTEGYSLEPDPPAS